MPQVTLNNANRSIGTLILFAKDVEEDGKGHHKLHAQPLANGNVHLYTSKEGFSVSHRLAGANPNPARRQLAEKVINEILARADGAAFVPLGWVRQEGETLRAANLKQVLDAGDLSKRLPPIAHLFDDKHADVLASFRNFVELGGIPDGQCTTELDFLAQLNDLRRLPKSNPSDIIEKAEKLKAIVMKDTSMLTITEQSLPENHTVNITHLTKNAFADGMKAAEVPTDLATQAEMMLAAFTRKGKGPSLDDALLAMVGGAYASFVKQASPNLVAPPRSRPQPRPQPQPMQLGEIQDMLKQAARERQVQANAGDLRDVLKAVSANLQAAAREGRDPLWAAPRVEAPRVEAASEWETVESDTDSSKSSD